MNLSRDDQQLEQELRELPTFSPASPARDAQWERIEQAISHSRTRQKARWVASGLVVAAAVALFSVNLPRWIVANNHPHTGISNAPHLLPVQNGPAQKQAAADQNGYVPAPYQPHLPVYPNQSSLSDADQAKCALYEKLAYAFQHIQTLRGKVEMITPGDPTPLQAEFQLREGNNPAVWEKAIDQNGRTLLHVDDNAYDWNQVAGHDDIHLRAPFDVQHEQPSTEAFFTKNEDGTNSSYVPRDPSTSTWGGRIVAPLGNLPAYMSDLNSWHVAGHDKLLNRPVTVIGAQPDRYVSSKINISSYKIWMDDETGMMLQFEAYDSQGHKTQAFTVKQLDINPRLDLSLFDIPQSVKAKAPQPMKK